jgi:signal peptidase II
MTKYIISQKLLVGDSIAVIPNIFHITLVHNTGAAFGLFRGRAPVLIAFSIIVIVFILVMYKKIVSAPLAVRVSAGLILGGAAGNLIDRLVWRFVVDFIDFRIWPVFNLSDSAICAGTFVLLFYSFRTRRARSD